MSKPATSPRYSILRVSVVLVRQLVEQTPKRLAESRELGHELGALPHRHGGVYGVYRDGAPEGRGDLLGGRYAGPVLRLGGARPEVRRHHHVGEREDRGLRRRFLGEDVERRARDGAFLERVVEVRLVHDAAARHVYEVGGRLHLRQRLSSFTSPTVCGVRGTCRETKSDSLEDLVRGLGPLHVHLAHPVLGDVRVVGEDSHAHTKGATRDDSADVAEPDQAERLARNLHALEGAPLPLPVPQGRVRRGDASRGGEHEPQGVLRRGHRVALRGVGDDDAALGGGLYIYVVHPDARAAYGLQVICPLHYLGTHPGGAADYETVVLSDRLQQLLRSESESDVDLEVSL